MSVMIRSILITVTICLAGGCAAKPAPLATTRPGGVHLDSVLATCFPPVDWKAEPLKVSNRHTHQVWISPTGQTAYGVAHFTLPLPIGADLVLWSFLQNMEKTEGSAKLIEKHDAPDLPGLRFEALGGLYHVRANLTMNGWEGWIAYAGELSKSPSNPAELRVAEEARDNTRLDVER